jgi:hypothetical protein
MALGIRVETISGENRKREAGQVFPPLFVFPSRGIQLT